MCFGRAQTNTNWTDIIYPIAFTNIYAYTLGQGAPVGADAYNNTWDVTVDSSRINLTDLHIWARSGHSPITSWIVIGSI